MTLLAKLPPQMKEIACSYNQKTIDMTSLTFVTICNDAIMDWQQHSSKGKQRNPQGLKAKKLSNIQCKDPQFQQQHQAQQHQGPRRLCGKHGGQCQDKVRKQDRQQCPHAHTAQPSNSTLMMTAPTHVVGYQCQMYLGYSQHFGAFIGTLSIGLVRTSVCVCICVYHC